jgi:signal recognition particle subunit SRP68
MDSPFALTWAAHDSQDVESLRTNRHRITRRIHKLRKYLGVQQKKKYVHKIFSQDDVAKDPKYWLIELLSMERDFLYALEVKSLGQLKNTMGNQKLFLTRLKRSLEKISRIIDISQDLSYTDQLELLIYKEFIGVQLSMTSGQYDNAINQLSLTRIGLQFLEEYGHAQNKGKYKSMIDSDLDSLFIGSIHRSKQNYSMDLDDLSKQIISTQQSSAIYTIIEAKDSSYLQQSDSSSIKELQWRSYTAKIKDDSLGRLLYKIQGYELSTMEDYDKLNALITQAYESHQNWLVNEVKEEDDEILGSYLQYTQLLTSIQRNASLLAGLKQISKLSLLDKINQELKGISEIPGVFNDDELVESLDTMKKYYNSLKLQIIGDYYYGSKAYREALLVFKTMVDSLENASLKLSFSFIDESTISQLHSTAKESLTSAQILSQLTSNATGTVLDDITNPNPKTIVDLRMAPISVKPVLFDVAFNYIHNDVPQKSTMASQQPAQKIENEATGEGETKRGFFGIFGR